MKTLIFGTLLFFNWILSGPLYGQNHCIPLEESQWLHEQAYKKQVADSVIELQGQLIELVVAHSFQRYRDFQELLNIEHQKYITQKESTELMEKFAASFREELNYYQKKDRKHRRQRNGLGVGVVALVILILAK